MDKRIFLCGLPPPLDAINVLWKSSLRDTISDTKNIYIKKLETDTFKFKTFKIFPSLFKKLVCLITKLLSGKNNIYLFSSDIIAIRNMHDKL